jgi:magnesium transporter
MLTIYDHSPEGLIAQEGTPQLTEQSVWIDLLSPSQAEEKEIEQALAIEVPTHEEQKEIEASSRLFKENGSHFMTATLLFKGDNPQPVTTPVTFILTGNRLVTLRYADPRAFQLCVLRSKRAEEDAQSGLSVLTTLLEAIVDRTADAIEQIQADVDSLSHSIFEVSGGKAAVKQKRLDELLRSVGRQGDVASKARESIYSLGRLITFFSLAANERRAGKLLKERVKTIARDIASLTDHVGFLLNKTVFLLDAVLGMITIEQNNISKIFSIAAVVFLPPTLLASIYGMNFQHMPEVDSQYGYPIVLGLMVLFAVLPYMYWKRKGWL